MNDITKIQLTNSVDPIIPYSSASWLRNMIERFGIHPLFFLRSIRSLDISRRADVPLLGSTPPYVLHKYSQKPVSSKASLI